jgi:hypothetical protein
LQPPQAYPAVCCECASQRTLVTASGTHKSRTVSIQPLQQHAAHRVGLDEKQYLEQLVRREQAPPLALVIFLHVVLAKFDHGLLVLGIEPTGKHGAHCRE